MKGLRAAVPAVLLALSLGAVHAASAAGDTDHARWSSFEVGAWVTLETEAVVGGVTTEGGETLELTALTKDGARLAVKHWFVRDGKKLVTAERARELPARAPEPASGATRTRTESSVELEVAGKTRACRLVEETITRGPVELRSRTWLCAEIPGSVARSEIETRSASGTSVLRARAVAWGKKRWR